ncbi:hypothetical protein C0J52_24073 [Blattella germanica]|nr:hypothetical protein C0J52_24073 [Blattella germanica]
MEIFLISDTGAPYVLYKDGMERPQGQPGQWGPGAPQDGGYPPQGSSSSGSPQQPCGPSGEGDGSGNAGANGMPPSRDQQQQGTMTSPVPSPYAPPQSVPPEPVQPPPPQGPPHAPGGGGEEDPSQQQQQQQQQQNQQQIQQQHSPGTQPPPQPPPQPQSHADVEQQQQQHPQQAPPPQPPPQPQPPPPPPPPQPQPQQQRPPPQCFPPTGGPTPGQPDMQQQGYPTQHYFKDARGHHAPAMPPHMLAPGSFTALHYLKQPGVMLTSLGPMGTGGDGQLGDASVNGHPYDVSPHLVFKNGMTPTLWPQDVPYPPDAEKDDAASTFGGGEDGSTQQTDRGSGQCFSPDSLQQYPAYFKDSKGTNHAAFGGGNFGALQYLKQGQGGKGCLPDVIQHGRSAETKHHPVGAMAGAGDRGPTLLSRGIPPTAVVKPELYFPQCYAPAFNHQPTAGPGAQFPGNPNPPPGNGEFKPPSGLPAQ